MLTEEMAPHQSPLSTPSEHKKLLLLTSMLAAFVSLTSACMVGEVDFAGKRCPCPSGWHCDPQQDRCAPGASPTEPGPPSITVSNLHVGWTTPNWIRWQWDAEGLPDGLLGYELVTGETEADVVSRTGSAVIWTADQNAELGRFLIPAVDGEDPVVVTLTDGHLPSKQYFGQLVAIDTAGRRSSSNVAGGRTTDPPNSSAVIFSEDDVGWSVPPGVELSDRFPYAGTYHYDYLRTCASGAPACFENPGRQGVERGPFNISLGAFSTTAFIEFALATEGPEISYWSQVRLIFSTTDKEIYLYPAWTLRSDGEYHVYQIPLRAFLDGEESMPHEVLQFALWEFNIGGKWSDGAYTSFDEVRIRW